jgi:hypothetical protein
MPHPQDVAVPSLPTLPQGLIDRIGRYGLARTDKLGEIERIHLWQTLIDGIKSYATEQILADRAAGRASAEPEKVAYTYASTQATNCASCGEHKHTPLRIDAMDGYVCLTCIDNKLGSLLGEFGYPAPTPTASSAPKAEAYIDGDCIASQVATPYAAPKAEGEAVHHTGRWSTDEIGANLYCDSFSHDLKLHISGDFEDREARKDCADELVRILNARFTSAAPVAQAAAGASELDSLVEEARQLSIGVLNAAGAVVDRIEAIQRRPSPRPEAAADRASGGGVPVRESDRQLMDFYSVDNLYALIDAQERHIAKLQAKLPPLRDELPRNPRIG